VAAGILRGLSARAGEFVEPETTMPKLDDTSWHLGSDDFDPDLPEENAATHIGFFVAWAINKGLWGASPGVDWTAAVQRVRDRVITGRTFLLEECDGKLFSGMLNDEGNAFAQTYYPRAYVRDFHSTLVVGLQSDYLVVDSWENYDRIAEVIEQRYTEKRQDLGGSSGSPHHQQRLSRLLGNCQIEDYSP